MKSTDTIQDLYLKTEQLLYFRLAFAGIALVLAGGLQWFDRADPDVYLWPAIKLVSAIVVYSGLALVLIKRKVIVQENPLNWLNGTLIFADVICLAALVHYTRGLESDLDVLYLLPILLSSYTFGRNGINATASLVSISYLVLMLIENKELLAYLDPSYNSGLASAYAHHLWRRVLAKSALLICLSFIWARFCEYMSGLAQQGARRLGDQLSANTVLMAEVKAHAARQELINSINSAVRSHIDLGQIFESACDELTAALHPDGCAIVCPSSYPSEPPFILQSATKGGAKGPVVFSPALCEFILQHKGHYEKSPEDGSLIKLYLFQDPADDPFFADVSQELQLSDIKSLIVKPMMYADGPKGAIIIAARDREREWALYELELVKAVAGQVAVAIEHGELVEQLSRKNKDLLQKNLNLDSKNLELRAVQSQLVHQEKMASLGRLVAGIAHELNNPINFVHGNLPYLREYFEDLKKIITATDTIPDEYRHEINELKAQAKYDFLTTDLDNILADLNEGSERIRHIVRNLKSFSRLDEAELKEASIQDGIESTLKILSQYYGRDKIPVEIDLAGLPPVMCYPGQLNQVWMNLLSNAAQALEKTDAPLVKIKTELDGENVLITIKDNGSGIKPEVQSKIFEPFYTTKPVGQGTGLGLSICHSIVERHGGHIWCESAPGQGTTFKVQIPVNARLADLVKATADAARDPD